MRADSDEPRVDPDAPDEDAVITAARTRRPGTSADLDPEVDVDVGALLAVPEAEERLDIVVVPPQSDEFTCARCHLICHRSRRVLLAGGVAVCRDCT